jgi:uncharacterized membrane protein YbhN (UPF0104 family)
MRARRSWLAPLITLAVIVMVAFVLKDKIALFSSGTFMRGLKAIPVQRLLVAVICTCAYYLVITGYDTLAFRTMRLSASKRSIALASFVSFAYSNVIGFGAVTNASMRYHIHKHAGVTLKDSTKVVAFYTLTLILGVLAVGSVVFLLSPIRLPLSLKLPFRTVQPFGWIALGLLASYVWLLTRGKPVKIWKWHLPHLPLKVVLVQVLVASADWMLSGATAFVLLPHSSHMYYTEFMSIYIVAQLAGMFSQVPGGVGVFETIMLLLLPKRASAAVTIGSLLAFRLVFYVIPFVIATFMLGKFEWSHRRRGFFRRAFHRLRRGRR